MSGKRELPESFERFSERYGALMEGFNSIGSSIHESVPLDEKTRHLVKLGISAGAGLSGGVKAHARRALEAGAKREEVEAVAILSLTTLGLPRSVAVYRWIREEMEFQDGK